MLDYRGLLGRQYKHILTQIDTACNYLVNYSKDKAYLRGSFMESRLFPTVKCEQTRYRYIQYMIALGFLSNPIQISDFDHRTWILGKKARTFIINKALLRQEGYGSFIPKKEIIDTFDPIVRNWCHKNILRVDEHRIPSEFVQQLMSKRSKIKFNSQSVNDTTIQNKLDLIKDNFIGKVPDFDFKIFYDNGVFNEKRLNYFIESVKNKVQKVPKEFQDFIKEHNKNITDERFKLRFNPKITLHWTPTRLRVKVFMRSFSSWCNSNKTLRQPDLDEYGLTHEYDISSTVPAVIKWVNKGIWNPGPLRNRIIKISKVPITPAFMKKIMFRIVFAPSFNLSWQYYKNIENRIDLDRSQYKRIYDIVHKELGDFIGTKVFYYESLIELQTIKLLKEQKYNVANVYDCFYSNATERIIKKTIKQATGLVRSYIN